MDQSITAVGHAAMSRNRLGPRTGREPRQETRIPLLSSMVGSTEAGAKGRGSRWGVITKVQGSVGGLEEDPHIPIEGICGPLVAVRFHDESTQR